MRGQHAPLQLISLRRGHIYGGVIKLRGISLTLPTAARVSYRNAYVEVSIGWEKMFIGKRDVDEDGEIMLCVGSTINLLFNKF